MSGLSELSEAAGLKVGRILCCIFTAPFDRSQLGHVVLGVSRPGSEQLDERMIAILWQEVDVMIPMD